MNQEEVKTIYTRYSSVYDRIFSHFFFPRIKLGINKSRISKGDLVIEVGIGTGMSLPLYPGGCKVVGIDVTRKMLEKAREKRRGISLTT